MFICVCARARSMLDAMRVWECANVAGTQSVLRALNINILPKPSTRRHRVLPFVVVDVNVVVVVAQSILATNKGDPSLPLPRD